MPEDPEAGLAFCCANDFCTCYLLLDVFLGHIPTSKLWINLVHVLHNQQASEAFVGRSSLETNCPQIEPPLPLSHLGYSANSH